MNKILELREKRAKAWEAAKAFLDSKRGADGLLSAEDVATYDKMEADVVNLGKEIDRLERQQALDAELSKPVNTPITGKPAAPTGEEKTGRASAEYKNSFWNAMRSKMPGHEILNAFRSVRIPRAAIWCRMNLSVLWWRHWRRRTFSVLWPM